MQENETELQTKSQLDLTGNKTWAIKLGQLNLQSSTKFQQLTLCLTHICYLVILTFA